MPLSDGQGGVDTNFHGIVRIGAARGTCRSRARQGGDMSLPRSRKGRRRVLHEASCLANTSYTTVRKNTTIFVFCEHFKPLPQAGTGGESSGAAQMRVKIAALFVKRSLDFCQKGSAHIREAACKSLPHPRPHSRPPPLTPRASPKSGIETGRDKCYIIVDAGSGSRRAAEGWISWWN